ncbi:MAG: ATP-binding cassette domain-containing protein [Gammaproteobacteria bacterium]|nr:ATP-binding cassette domain-containing protein [Gammaproteobacteria bacterium]MDP2141516.1 ATP-binding cassette domain-containing protein [Gammaproteobacteria bacterium]MDP2347459.1 ATP-binding cassette domain-containing protein [Gammaproteobacteria bacterium]
MHENVLELSKVCKKYGAFTAVDDMSFVIPKGAIYGFLGPNGAGKTTTIRMILDILKPDSGSINILGETSALNVRQRIGYLPEEKGLYKKMKVWAIISYFATLKGMDKKLAKQRAFELLETYGLKDFADAKVESLSKGMGQKVQVLSAVAHRPELVILDEPFSGLDPVNQEVLEQLINDMAHAGQTVIFSTHIMQHAERLCDRMLLIAKGRKIFDGTLDQARAIIPRRVILECQGDIAPVLQTNGIICATEKFATDATDTSGTRHWEIQIQEHANPQLILQRCFENGIPLTRFDYTQPSLHDVFVHLVGSDAREHSFR